MTHDRRDFLKRCALAAGALALRDPRRFALAGTPRAARAWKANRPFNIVALGDSIVWGQGLDDRSKFTFIVRDWLAAQLQAPVTLSVFAHSGAVLQADSAFDDAKPYYGEVPNSWPSIPAQARVAAGQPSALTQHYPPAPPAGEIDLVIVDGGINDVEVTKIVAGMEDLVAFTRQKCEGPMQALLTQLAIAFPNARVVVTGYFPIVSAQTSLEDLGVLVALLGDVPDAGAAISIIKAVGTLDLAGVAAAFDDFLAGRNQSRESFRAFAAQRSAAFYATATSALRSAVDATNADFHRNYRFADPGFGPEHAYGTPDTWLWHVSTAGSLPTPDLAAHPRREACLARYGTLEALFSVDEEVDAAKCYAASMSHPNRVGAQVYANAVIRELQGLLPTCP